MTREQAIKLLLERPAVLGHALGFTKLQVMHNEWIVDMVRGTEDKTLQAHRGSYKTTCVSIALAIIIILLPNKKTLFLRKTDTDVKEIIRQVQNILRSDEIKTLVRIIHGVELQLTAESATEINTNLPTDKKGTSQLVAIGINGSLTGKHYDRIFTDDIVNVKDRLSKAERDHTKVIYQELQNVRNRGGRIYNTGTPWHKDDAFSIMPSPIRYDCYHTGLIDKDQLAEIRASMTSSLFAANYELRHIASDDVIFFDPQTGADPAFVENGDCHIDAAYGGEDFTAFTIFAKKDGKYYLFGKLWQRHVDDVMPEIEQYYRAFLCGKAFCEDNGDKGYLAKDLRKRGIRCVVYHEKQNKFIKITSYLKSVWKDVVFVSGTDQEYIAQICDYNENAEHDDAPDSAACAVRRLWGKKENDYQPIWNK